MSRGSVLVIDDDEWVGRLLAVALRESDYEVVCCPSAVEGFDKAVEIVPDCIICDVDLPDVDGFWVARKIRMSPDRVSVTPFLFLSGLDDRDTRLQGFHVGADVYMTKPFRIDEVVAQVGALVQMAARLRQSRKTFLSVPPTEAAMVGDLAQMSVATVLTLLDMERRSGKLEVSTREQKAVLFIVAGAIGGATLNEEKRDPLELLRTLLAWTQGRFAFHPDTSETKATRETSINALLMEAVRLEDERREGLEAPPGSAPRSSVPRSGRPPRMPRVIPSSMPAQPSSTAPEGDVGKLSLEIEKGWSDPPPAPAAAPPAVIAPGPPRLPATPPPAEAIAKAPAVTSAETPPNAPATSTPLPGGRKPTVPGLRPPSPANPSPAKPPTPNVIPPAKGSSPGAPKLAPTLPSMPAVRPPVAKSPTATTPTTTTAGKPAPAVPPRATPNATSEANGPNQPQASPSPLRPAPARAVPTLPNTRVGQGSGEK
jgi:two-component system OmpR family response regulator